MTKIPVGAAIAQAYRFAFGSFPTILGIVWLPSAILAACGFALMRQSMAFSMAIATHNFAGIAPVLAVLIPFYLLTFILLFMQIAGITEQALGLRKGSPFYYFSLGKPVWRLIGAFLLLIFVLIVGYVVAIVAGVLLGIAALFLAKFMHPPAILGVILGIAGIIALIGAFCAYIYALVRVSFLLIPVVIAEGKISLKRGWALGRGNFWRMFAILLSVLIPVLIVECVFMFGFLFQGFPPIPPPLATPDQLSATQAAMAAWNVAMMSRMTGYWYITYPFFIVFTVLFYGLSAGAQAFAYRAVVPKGNPETVN